MSTALCPALRIFEVLLAGFNGGTDETDDKVLWVAAPSEQHVHDAIKGHEVTFAGEVDGAYLSDADYVLPGAIADFENHLKTGVATN
ncbi:hypothetical protein [Comamonas thiooxydans]|uniref:hypothetical protein n=1 Tax=Comamonas thiooxydans TaxID=363952 RepID=UPI000B41EC10|nr:hypothetical protein [Comamonas thiooxydans]